MPETKQEVVTDGNGISVMELQSPVSPETGSGAEHLAEVAHDARNMVTALGLYCDLLDEPGVLDATHQHYGKELKLVAAASRRLVDRLMALELEDSSVPDARAGAEKHPHPQPPARYWNGIPSVLITDLSWELEANRNLLAALAGPSIQVSIETEGGTLPIRMASEDLTRILVNLVKNAVEAMPKGGRIYLRLRETPEGPETAASWVTLNFEDNGPGFERETLEQVFDPGFTTRSESDSDLDSRTAGHKGLGLSITRSLVESAGGRIHAANRDPAGACIQIELPVRAC